MARPIYPTIRPQPNPFMSGPVSPVLNIPHRPNKDMSTEGILTAVGTGVAGLLGTVVGGPGVGAALGAGVGALANTIAGAVGNNADPGQTVGRWFDAANATAGALGAGGAATNLTTDFASAAGEQLGAGAALGGTAGTAGVATPTQPLSQLADAAGRGGLAGAAQGTPPPLQVPQPKPTTSPVPFNLPMQQAGALMASGVVPGALGLHGPANAMTQGAVMGVARGPKPVPVQQPAPPPVQPLPPAPSSPPTFPPFYPPQAPAAAQAPPPAAPAAPAAPPPAAPAAPPGGGAPQEPAGIPRLAPLQGTMEHRADELIRRWDQYNADREAAAQPAPGQLPGKPAPVTVVYPHNVPKLMAMAAMPLQRAQGESPSEFYQRQVRHREMILDAVSRDPTIPARNLGERLTGDHIRRAQAAVARLFPAPVSALEAAYKTAAMNRKLTLNARDRAKLPGDIAKSLNAGAKEQANTAYTLAKMDALRRRTKLAEDMAKLKRNRDRALNGVSRARAAFLRRSAKMPSKLQMKILANIDRRAREAEGRNQKAIITTTARANRAYDDINVKIAKLAGIDQQIAALQTTLEGSSAQPPSSPGYTHSRGYNEAQAKKYKTEAQTLLIDEEDSANAELDAAHKSEMGRWKALKASRADLRELRGDREQGLAGLRGDAESLNRSLTEGARLAGHASDVAELRSALEWLKAHPTSSTDDLMNQVQRMVSTYGVVDDMGSSYKGPLKYKAGRGAMKIAPVKKGSR